MRAFHIIVCLAFTVMLIWLNRAYTPTDATVYGGLSWLGWLSILAVTLAIGFVVLVNDSTRAFGFFRSGWARLPELRSREHHVVWR
jgi:hypothetical protein